MNDNPEEGTYNKLLRKVKENPAFPIGLVALAGIVGYRLCNIKGRTKKMSLYLIELRLAAQGTFLACIVCGAGYKMYEDLFKPKENPKKQ